MGKNLFSIRIHNRFGFASFFYDTFKYFYRIDYPLTRILFDFGTICWKILDEKENTKIGNLHRTI